MNSTLHVVGNILGSGCALTSLNHNAITVGVKEQRAEKVHEAQQLAAAADVGVG